MSSFFARRLLHLSVFSAAITISIAALATYNHVRAAKGPNASVPVVADPAASEPNNTDKTNTTAAPAQPTTAFHNSIAARYNYAFGKDTPFLPSNATTINGQFYDPKSFYTAQYCGHCHKESLHQWRESAHSNSFRSPWYLKNVNQLISEKGVQYSRHCEGCHNQPALLSGDLSQGMPAKRPFENEGVTCSACHSIVSVNTTGTGSYVMGIPAVLVDDKGQPITRPVTDGEILAHLDRHSRAVMRPFYRTSEFCAACHKAAVPHILNDYKWLRAFTAYDEWQGSSFAKESPLPFYRKDAVSTCQTCHMKRDPITDASPDPGAKTDENTGATTLANHRWPGANTLVPDYFKFPDQMERTKAMLQNGFDGKGVINVDIFALEFEKEAANNAPPPQVIAPLGRVPVTLAPGQAVIADVVLQNKGIGHSFVPEVRDFYESWVNFTVKDASGKTLSESGFLAPDGSLDPNAHIFSSRIINKNGEFNDQHQVWNTRVLAFNNAFQSGRSQLVRYRFRLPKDISGAITITATVRNRRFNQHFVDYAMDGQHFPEPIVDVASQSRTFNIGDTQPIEPAPAENPLWMRWNNYGIALLDAQQYASAVAAFSEVAKLRPDYADAYTNIAIVDVLWEKYDDAKPNIAKALTILPGDPRALYYRAIVERNAGSVENAITDLSAVLVKYPRSRDALRELGFSYYQQHQYDKARDCYEQLQKIDPDDLSAHYNLAILYRRLGNKQKAAFESARFADQKDDPTASVYALEYLRKHPEIANESVAWHTHDLTGEKKKPEKIDYKYIPGAGF
jgi:tetratricopeptide (TPR) repeat protein